MQPWKSDKEITFEMRVSPSTVKRVWSYWLSNKEYLPLKKRDRPKMELTEKEKEVIKEAKKKYRLGARRLERIIEQVYGIHILTIAFTNFWLKRAWQRRRAKEEEKEKAMRGV